MPVDIPHLDLPFRYRPSVTGMQASVVEQDSPKDIANCVETIMLTPVNWRDEAPGFGSPDLAFRKLPIGADAIISIVSEQESRVSVLVREDPILLDQLAVRVNIELQSREGESS